MLAFDQLTSDTASDQIYIAKADGSAPRRVGACVAPCVSHRQPAWSPDGRSLAIATATGSNPDRFGIAVVDLQSGSSRQVVDHSSAVGEDVSPRWSPDGRTLVFWRHLTGTGGAHSAIFTVATDGTRLRQLTRWSMLAGDVDWQPNGATLVFATRPLIDEFDHGPSVLYTMQADGTHLAALASGGPAGSRATQPRWTPDGRNVIYTQVAKEGFPLHTAYITADGKAGAVVLADQTTYTHPVLRP